MSSGRFLTAKAVAVAATTAVDLSWVDQNDVAVVPAEGQRIVLLSMTVSNVATAKNVKVFQDNDAGDDLDATEILESFHFAGVGSFHVNYDHPVPTKKINAAGTNDLHILASTTGNIDYIIRAKLLSPSS